jgi:hypothetical protein
MKTYCACCGELLPDEGHPGKYYNGPVCDFCYDLERPETPTPQEIADNHRAQAKQAKLHELELLWSQMSETQLLFILALVYWLAFWSWLRGLLS